MKIAECLDGYQEALLRLVFPASCSVCQTLLELREQGLCTRCLNRLSELRFGAEEMILSHEFSYLDEGWVLYPYESPAKEVLTGIKFLGKRWLVNVFNEAIRIWGLQAAPEIGYDALIPIPMDQGRLLERQFNQAALIARLIAGHTNIPLRTNVLSKRWHTPAQSHLNREARLANLREVFRIRRDGRAIEGRSFLLVDDILTTGATAEEAARLLKHRGAKRVGIFALAYTESAGHAK